MPTFGGFQVNNDPLFSDVQFEPKKEDTVPTAAPKLKTAGSAGEGDDV